MKFHTTVGKDNRITINFHVAKVLKIKKGDLVEVNIRKSR